MNPGEIAVILGRHGIRPDHLDLEVMVEIATAQALMLERLREIALEEESLSALAFVPAQIVSAC
ncbi:MAG: hypothetical protein QM638_02945 [Nocardioides sp.]|uniref:hypothetical protein n=1 Tax=Nocardioides sp. TaxID=35761 RepID=UPI0039E5C228